MAEKKYDASSISILEGLEAVRKRPGMYIGSVGTKGLNHLIYEIADNAVDEHLAGYCTQIDVSLNKDGTATIKDMDEEFLLGFTRRQESRQWRLSLRFCMRVASSVTVDIRFQVDFTV